MADIIFEQEYSVNTTNINTNKQLSLSGLLGFIQDIASAHAQTLNFGYEEMKEKGVFWVLTRQKLRMKKWAKWNDKVKIKTWVLPTEKGNSIREFEIYLDAEKIGACSTSWMILDTINRRIKKINDKDFVFSPRVDYNLDFHANKIRLPEGMKESHRHIVKNSDLDMHNHVNNVKYSQWILDSIPLEYHTKQIREFEINFLKETFLDDEIICLNNLEDANNDEYFFEGKNAKNNSSNYTAKIIVQLNNNH